MKIFFLQCTAILHMLTFTKKFYGANFFLCAVGIGQVFCFRRVRVHLKNNNLSWVIRLLGKFSAIDLSIGLAKTLPLGCIWTRPIPSMQLKKFSPIHVGKSKCLGANSYMTYYALLNIIKRIC